MNPRDWPDAIEGNQQRLLAELALLRQALERHAGQPATHQPAEATAPDAAPLLDEVAAVFGLTPFERTLLLLCAAVELDARFGPLCAAAHGDARRPHASFSLALAALPGAHWSALTPAAPLRRWRLIEVGTGDALTLSPLRIDERLLHHLVGLGYVDPRVQDLIGPPLQVAELPASHRAVAERIAAFWRQPSAGDRSPVVALWGDDAAAQRAIVAQVGVLIGRTPMPVRAADLMRAAGDLPATLTLLQREALLDGAVPVLDDPDGGAMTSAAVIERLPGPWFVLAPGPLGRLDAAVLGIGVDRPGADEQRALWRTALGELPQPQDRALDALTGQFSLGAGCIHAAVRDARLQDGPAADGETLRHSLWAAARRQSSPQLEELAQRILPAVGWDDLVLPPEPMRTLRDIVASVRQRYQVHERWGLARQSSRGLGLSALFAGQSGTGKTLAAEVVAGALELDLVRIDLSAVVSKYIGETEKKLRLVFDAAEDGGAVLLFDEADALFGKRSEVHDSHDRYANIEVSYLLQRMETYRGLAILTTNMKSALDSAFLRRLRFVVQFPFPDAVQRREIWSRVYPAAVPTEGLDPAKLAHLNVAGGSIRNIALNAAFLAADAGEPVRMGHLVRAARSEYAKLDRPLAEAEVGGWT